MKSALCIIVDTKGSTPRKISSKMQVFEDGRIKGTIGGGNLEKKVIENALEQIKKNEAKLFKHDLLHQHNMCCGGTVYIYIEPMKEKLKLYIFGAGHTGVALAEAANKLDFQVVVIDDRKEYIDAIQTNSFEKINATIQNFLPTIHFDKSSYICILTYDHQLDRDILSYCIKQKVAYIGMIGSQRKIEMTKKIFIDSGIADEEELNKVNMPIGKNILADTPEEIAISILAELIETKNKK
ncbi:MAG: XdhC family protein [Flavobacteriia bacterium]|nr:XdhC family protein [Flavobacteriia bacterium]